MSKGIFDSFTAQLEDFVRDNHQEIGTIEVEISGLVREPLMGIAGTFFNQARSIQLIDECLHRAETSFSRIASRLSLDSWMSVLRRFPNEYGFSDTWQYYVTLGLIRYASSDRDTTMGKIAGKQEFGLSLSYTAEDLLDAFRLAYLARELAKIAGVRRWVGKGARLQPSVNNPLHLEISEEIKESVSEYERRRPRLCLLQDEGLLTYQSGNESELNLIVLEKPRRKYLYVPGRNISLLCRYFPRIIDTRPIYRQLCAYQDAIEDVFSLTPDDILHFLVAITNRIVDSLPTRGYLGDEAIVLAKDDGTSDYDHRLHFLFRICHLGFLRFPREVLVNRLGEARSPLATNIIHRFLEAFVVSGDKKSDDIDLITLRPFPFVYSSAGGEVYIDLLAPIDFIAWIIARAKEWYSTQHGDRFTLALKKWIESQTTAEIVGWKMVVTDSGGRNCEIDLLVSYSMRLFAIECKAFAKPRSFFRGDPAAVRQRLRRIKKATDQAKVAANAVRDAISRGDSSIPAGMDVEWLVCTPTQEYLRPLGQYGFAIERVPRVCTPEELLIIFANKTDTSQGSHQVGNG